MLRHRAVRLCWALGYLLTSSGVADKRHAGLVIHGVPEHYEQDGTSLKAAKQKIRFFTGRPESGAVGDAMGAIVYFFRKVMGDINRRSDILPDYVVELHLADSMCQPQVAVRSTLEALYRNPPGFFHMVFGPVCSEATAAVNDAIQTFRMFQIAPISRSPAVGDRARYPFLCRTSPPLQFGSIGIARMCKLFGWSRLGAVHDPSGLTLSTINALTVAIQAEVEAGYPFDLGFYTTSTHLVQGYNVTDQVVSDLRTAGVRILVVALYEDFGTFFFCSMYRHGYYGRLAQSVLATTWWGEKWIREQAAAHEGALRCGRDELLTTAHGMLSLGQAAFVPSTTMRHGIMGHTLSEIKASYLETCGHPDAEGCHEDFASYDFDALALAVQTFHVWLYEQGHALSEIDYDSDAPRQALFNIASNSSFVGTSGPVSFFRGDPRLACERLGTFSVRQYVRTFEGVGAWQPVASYTHDGGFGTLTPWSTILWPSGATYMGDGNGFGGSRAAPGKPQNFGNATGLDHIPVDRLQCAVGHMPNQNRSSCEPCPRGTNAPQLGSWECEPCNRGTFAPEPAAATCSFCPPGQHQPNSGASSCHDCPEGTVSDPEALWQCLPCPVGTFSSQRGQSECSRCAIGAYSDNAGATECSSCEGERMTTAYMAAESQESCHCTAGTYREASTRACQDCPEGMICAEGSDMLHLEAFWNLTERTTEQQFPVLREGHMSTSAEPLAVYKCAHEEHCPGQVPGQACASGREGIACGRCLEGFAEASEGHCFRCDGNSMLLPWAFVAAAVVFVVAVATLSVNTNWEFRSPAVILLLTVCGILVSSLQTMGVFSRSPLNWQIPLSTILAVVRCMHFEMSILRFNCILGANPVKQYILRQCFLPTLLPFILLTLLLKRRWLPSDWREMVAQFANTVGTLCNVFFISILASSVSSLYCYQHPGAQGYSMLSDPSITCYEGSSHTAMLITSAVAVAFVPLPFVAAVVLATHHYPKMLSSVASSGRKAKDLLGIRSTRFLFFRFHGRRYYYGLALLIRNTCICMVPVVWRDTVALQVAFMCAILSSSTLVQQQLSPWLSPVANVVDGVITQLMVLMLVSGVMATDNLKSSAGVLGGTSFTCLSTAAIFTVLYALVELRHDRRSFYDKFICHHKAEAAAQARYLKTLLEQATGRPVFIDSDDLKDLHQLFDIVRTRVKQVVVYLTRCTMSRPWCAGEIATAMTSRIEVIGAITPSFICPSERQLSNPDVYLDGLAYSNLQEHGVSAEVLCNALRHFLASAQFIELPRGKKGRERLQDLAQELLSKRRSTSPHAVVARTLTPPRLHTTPGMVVISADPGDDEGIAAAGILAGEINTDVLRHTCSQVCCLADYDDAAAPLETLADSVVSCTALLVVLSSRSLYCLPQLVAIVEVMMLDIGGRMSQRTACCSTSSTTSPKVISPTPKSPRGLATMSTVNSCVSGHSGCVPRSSARHSRSRERHPCVVPVWIPGFDFPEQHYYDTELPKVWTGSARRARDCMRTFFEKIAVALPVEASDKVIHSHTAEILERIEYRAWFAPEKISNHRSWLEVESPRCDAEDDPRQGQALPSGWVRI